MSRTLVNEVIACPACGHASSHSTGIAFHGHRGGPPWRRCLACGTFFESAPYSAAEFVSHAESSVYGSVEQGKSVCDFKSRLYRSVLALLRRYAPPPAVLVDAGCAYGGFLVQARKAGYEVSGLDALPQAVNYVSSLGFLAEVSFSIADVKSLTDRTVDIVTCLDCNYYWADQPLELRRVYQKLKPGGYLALRVANKSWVCAVGLAINPLAPRISRALFRTAVNDHRFSMPLRSLLKVIESCGFDVVYTSPRGALSSDRIHWTVKAWFLLGSVAWTTTGICLAPGALVLARKPAETTRRAA